MRIEVLRCDLCGEIIEKAPLCFGHDGVRNFWELEVSVFNIEGIKAEKKLIDLTDLTFCSKHCLIDYLEEKLEDI